MFAQRHFNRQDYPPTNQQYQNKVRRQYNNSYLSQIYPVLYYPNKTRHTPHIKRDIKV